MHLTTRSAGPVRVVIVGGGVAALETLIGLRTLAGERVELELISPEDGLARWPLSVTAALGAVPEPELGIPELVRNVGAEFTNGAVAAIDPTARTVALESGRTRSYDALVLAIGARVEERIPGAITFGGPVGTERFRRLLDESEAGEVSRLVFAVPNGPAWPLTLYELALLTADRLRRASRNAEITFITPESAPVPAFGRRASATVLEELENRGIRFVAGVEAEEIVWGELRAGPGRIRIAGDAFITLPSMRGPALEGLSHTDDGFIAVDAYGRVPGLLDVYAAGDATAFPVKHGGIAAQQADTVAEAIAAYLGAPVQPAPFRPVLRGTLSAGRRKAETTALWWPPGRVAGRYLGPSVGARMPGHSRPENGIVVDLELDPQTGVPALRDGDA